MASAPCPSCNKRLRVPDSLVGKRVKCPGCGAPFDVPSASVGQSLVADASIHESAPLPNPPRAANTRRIIPNSNPDATAKDGSPDSLAPPMQSAELGPLAQYRVLQVLGRGGMGTVYRAEDVDLRRQVAIKTMLPAIAANPNSRERFLREARAAAAIEHEHIIAVYQVGVDRGVPFLAMPLLKGEPLDEHLKSRGTLLPIAETVRIGKEIAEGLAAAHEQGMIHRDIKPANIWLEGDRRKVKILDFGLARIADDSSHLTHSGAVVGTPAYMAPEQARGDVVDGRADLFSLGCILYQMCTGTRPFIGENTMAILSSLALDDPKPPKQANPDVPAALSELVMKLLEKKPADRYGSAREVADALAALERGTAASSTGSARTNRPRRVAIGLLVAMAVLVPLGIWLSGWLRPVDPPAKPLAEPPAEPHALNLSPNVEPIQLSFVPSKPREMATPKPARTDSCCGIRARTRRDPQLRCPAVDQLRRQDPRSRSRPGSRRRRCCGPTTLTPVPLSGPIAVGPCSLRPPAGSTIAPAR